MGGSLGGYGPGALGLVGLFGNGRKVCVCEKKHEADLVVLLDYTALTCLHTSSTWDKV